MPQPAPSATSRTGKEKTLPRPRPPYQPRRDRSSGQSQLARTPVTRRNHPTPEETSSETARGHEKYPA